MTLNAYVAEKRLALLESLKQGLPPQEGKYEAAIFLDAKDKSHPQLGTTRYEPDKILIEYIYPDPLTTPQILTVTLTPPERIVFLPVPEWVIESIWQGEIQGSYHFESDAKQLLDLFSHELAPENNLKWFGPQQAKRRE